VSNISELRAAVKRLRGELEDASANLTAALVAETGITIGDIVRGTGRFEGAEFSVTFVDVRWDGKPWLHGVKRRADGSWGTGTRHLYENWERVA
jgi:hypothetical protein